MMSDPSGRGPRRDTRPGFGVCHQFVRTGRCQYGNKCKYYHDPSSPSPRSVTQARGAATSNGFDSRLSKYKRLLLWSSSEPAAFSAASTAETAFLVGKKIVEETEDSGIRQEVINLLASEEGLSAVRHVVDTLLPLAALNSTAAKVIFWDSQIGPLLHITTHKSVTNSAILEEKIASIFNFLVGVGGRRMARLFNFVLGLSSAVGRPPQPTNVALAELSLAALAQMIDCSTSNMTNEAFGPIVDKLALLLTSAGELLPAEEFSKRQADTYAAYIRRRLRVGDEMLEAAVPLPNTFSGQLPSFQLRRDFPGHLSAEGPRHSNDHADIRHISILPTYEEIVGGRDEYLPTTDPSQWHKQGISGRLDREFRLLREDTVGQLRDVVRTELEILQRAQQNANNHGKQKQQTAGRPGKDSIRYCTYQDADAVNVDFDRRTGFEFTVRFLQPADSFKKGKGPSTASDSKTKALARRCEWWARAKKRLQPGGLLCAVDSRGSALFFTVAESTLRTAADAKSRDKPRHSKVRQTELNNQETLADDPVYSYVRLNLVGDESFEKIDDALEWVVQGCSRDQREQPRRRVLVEFPGILLDSFRHTLKALQTVAEKLNIPFSDLIAPEHVEQDNDAHAAALLSHVSGALVDIPPPRYMEKPGFSLSMDCLTANGPTLRHSLQAPLSPEEITKHSRLDETQSIALLDALSRSVALIQGPPGTGKTFAGVEILKVLLGNQKEAKLGPILIVCYTNHALDQLLEHVLDAKNDVQIIRMGSRSKSERLKNLNLREVAGKALRTRHEKSQLWEHGKKLDSCTTELQDLLSSLERSTSWKAVVRLLHDRYPEYHRQLFGTTSSVLQNDHGKESAGEGDGEDDGFQTVVRRPDKRIESWLRGTNKAAPRQLRRPEELVHVDLFALANEQRHVLFNWWKAQSFREFKSAIGPSYKEYTAAKKRYDQAQREVDLRCLTQANVLGVTTTGLARNLELLRHLPAKVLLCEEAGEVLEAHMLTSFLPSVEHAILIGDHQQLRPQVQNYELRSDNPRGVQFSFDMSLFERLVQPPAAGGGARLAFSQLATQRRMHPSISALIRAPLYPALKDGDNVKSYPEVPGFARRLFWLDHGQLENGASDEQQQLDPTSTSRTNSFEVDMVEALVSHLFKQGAYASGDIAVLTPYLGQMQLLQRRLSSLFEITFNERDLADLEAAAALDGSSSDEDNNGSPDKAGPSRAPRSQDKKVLVPAKTTLLRGVRVATVDNFQGEEAKVVVVSLVRSNRQRRCGFLSTANRINVLLSRAQHGMFLVGNSDTCSGVPMWQQVVEQLQAGGNFGPSLPLQCPRHPEHTFEASTPDHFLQFAPDGGCMRRCDKRHACGHACVGRCHSDMVHAAVKCLEPCPRKLKGGCDHACTRPCGDPCIDTCKVRLTGSILELPCGHVLRDPLCYQTQNPKAFKCQELVSQTVPGCGHAVDVACHLDVAATSFLCAATCGTILPCGHPCRRECSQCNRRFNEVIVSENHGTCTKPCERPYGTCQHKCNKPCHDGSDCPPCPAPCDVRCSHSKCSQLCHEPCVPCAEEKCASCCPHSACSMPCAAPCDWVPCSKRCTKLLECGHQCPSVCGEPCPSKRFCHECGDKDVLDQVIDFIMMGTYQKIDPDEDPCIFPDCGHVLAVSSMDGIMEMTEHYIMDKNSGHPISLAASSMPFDMKEAKVCPQCRGSLRSVARYGRIVRRAILDESTKKFIQWANQEHEGLAMQFLEEKERLEKDATAGKKPEEKKKATLWKQLKADRRANRIRALTDSTETTRYAGLMKLRDQVSQYAQRVKREEQPFQRVADYVRFAQLKRRGGGVGAADGPPNTASQVATTTEFAFDETVIQVRSHLLASLLLLRCDILALQDLASHLGKTSMLAKHHLRPSNPGTQAVTKAFEQNWFACLFQECEDAVKTARAAEAVRQEVEGHILYAQLCLALVALSKWGPSEPHAAAPGTAAAPADHAPDGNGADVQGQDDGGKTTMKTFAYSSSLLKDAGLQHVADAWLLIQSHAPTKLFEAELASVEAALEGKPFYQTVTTDELKAVYAAMAGELRGSGHWYTCEQGHYFTVGECGMPMEQARCPECGSAVGGRDHTNAAGVQRAVDMDELGRGLSRMAL